MNVRLGDMRFADLVLLVAMLSAVYLGALWMKRIDAEIRFMEARQQILIEREYWREYLAQPTPTATPVAASGDHT